MAKQLEGIQVRDSTSEDNESTPSGRFLKAISNPKLPREEASSIA